MRSIKNITLGLATVGVMSLSGCAGDYLDTIPSTSVSETTINTSLDNLYIALNGIHKEMVSQESGYQCLGGEPGFMMSRDAEADDMNWQTNTWMKAAYLGWQCNMNETNGYNYKFWQIYYQWILNANKILAGLEEVEITSQELFDQIKGEALCIRAWAHFNLVQLYAKRYEAGKDNTQDGIPYREKAVAEEQARNSVEDVYAKINNDLDEACILLSGIKVNDVNHYSEMVAWGLKARVALAMQDYNNAAVYAGKSVSLAEAGGHRLMTGSQLNCGFANITTDTKEAMYAAMTPDDKTVYFYSYYAYMSWNFNSSAIRQGVKCINVDAYETMSETDLRRAWWDPTGEASVPSSSYAKNAYQNRKFTARSTADAVGDVAFMRLAEMYLTQAEALARAGKDSEAQAVFTKFQITRDPSYVSKGNIGDALAEGRFIVKDCIADAFLQNTLLMPEEYSVVATLNLNGDYISDQLAAMVGGIGIAPGANINYDSGHAIFEATHGTAPDIADQDKANPCSVLLSGCMLLEYIGWTEAAQLITSAIEKTFKADIFTADLAFGKQAYSTSAFSNQILSIM